MVRHSENETSRPQVTPRRGYPEPVLRFAFYAFIFSIPYESLNMGIDIGNVTLSKIVGYMFFGAALLQPRVSFKSPSPAFFCFSMYLYIYVLYALYQGPGFDGPMITHVLTFAQLLVLFWVSQNMMAHSDVTQRALLTFGVSTLSLAAMVLLGPMREEIAQGRISQVGNDANMFSALLAFGLLALVGLTNSGKIVSKKIRWMVWSSFGILALSIVQSGSRGCMVSLVVALLVLAMKDGALRINPRAALLVFLAVGAVIVIAYQSDAVRERWERTLDTGEVSGRDKIWESSVEMFSEKPLLGWGPVVHLRELGLRSWGDYVVVDPHNSYLWLLNEVGLLGAVPVFVGLWLCCLEAWRARVGVHGPLPMAMIVFLLLMNLSITIFYTKVFWVVFAYAFASGSAVRSSNWVKRISRKRVLATT